MGRVMRDDTRKMDLIARARQGDRQALGELLEAYRDGLHRLAARRLDERVAVRVDASDLIQMTFLEAQRNLAQFQGEDEPAWRAWLEGILGHNVANAVRDHARLLKRDVRREQSMDDSHGAASPLKRELDGDDSSPSQRVMRGEEADRLLRALESLPPEQRLAVRLRHLEGWQLLEIAEHMGRTAAATAGLIKRGLQTLRRRMRED